LVWLWTCRDAAKRTDTGGDDRRIIQTSPYENRSAGLLIGVGLLASCAAASPDTTPLQTHYIHIQDAVNPQRLYVHVGDEVRWQNLRSEPVKISLLGHLSGSGVSCQTGFSRFGSLDDTATIPPNAYVSLCFARAGSIQYNVWLKPEDPLRSMIPTAKIVISARAT
jgi:plastocyanin